MMPGLTDLKVQTVAAPGRPCGETLRWFWRAADVIGVRTGQQKVTALGPRSMSRYSDRLLLSHSLG